MVLDYYTGEIILMACGFAPVGTLPCDGRVLPVNGNTALYAAIGTKFNGGMNYYNQSFAIPNLPAPINTVNGGASPMYCIVNAGIFPSYA